MQGLSSPLLVQLIEELQEALSQAMLPNSTQKLQFREAWANRCVCLGMLTRFPDRQLSLIEMRACQDTTRRRTQKAWPPPLKQPT